MDKQTRQVMHSSENMEWRTPPELFQKLNQEFNFNFDAAADKENHLCPYYATEHGAWEEKVLMGSIGSDYKWTWDESLDGLSCIWGESTFCNPPYGRGVGKWFKKAYEESQMGATCVLLTAARPDVISFHEYAMKAHEIRFIKGRVKFLLPDGQSSAPAPFPSMITIFKPNLSGLSSIDTPKMVSWSYKE